MSEKREIACGVDVHNKFIVATILSSDGLKLQDRFETSLEELLKFKNWLKENGCYKVALESTGNYWLPIYHVLEGSVNFILANAYQIKHIPGRKTDTLDYHEKEIMYPEYAPWPCLELSFQPCILLLREPLSFPLSSFPERAHILS
jgi:Transposase